MCTSWLVREEDSANYLVDQSLVSTLSSSHARLCYRPPPAPGSALLPTYTNRSRLSSATSLYHNALRLDLLPASSTIGLGSATSSASIKAIYSFYSAITELVNCNLFNYMFFFPLVLICFSQCMLYVLATRNGLSRL